MFMGSGFLACSVLFADKMYNLHLNQWVNYYITTLEFEMVFFFHFGLKPALDLKANAAVTVNKLVHFAQV